MNDRYPWVDVTKPDDMAWTSNGAVCLEFGSFSEFIWRFVDGRPTVNRLRHKKDNPSTSRESDALSKDLKKRNFKFPGSNVC